MGSKIESVWKFDNDMIMVFDQSGNQMSLYQGRYTKDLHKKIVDRSDEGTKWYGFDEPIKYSEAIKNFNESLIKRKETK